MFILVKNADNYFHWPPNYEYYDYNDVMKLKMLNAQGRNKKRKMKKICKIQEHALFRLCEKKTTVVCHKNIVLSRAIYFQYLKFEIQ